MNSITDQKTKNKRNKISNNKKTNAKFVMNKRKNEKEIMGLLATLPILNEKSLASF